MVEVSRWRGPTLPFVGGKVGLRKMNTYHHVQRAGVTLAIPAVIASVLIVLAIIFRVPAVLAGIAVLAAAAWMFRSMTIEVTPGELRWQFGNGWFRRRVALSDVRRCEVVRTTWMDGWGIHHTAHGWLYNVGGHDALGLELSGGRRIALGTDDAAGLASVLAAPRV